MALSDNENVPPCTLGTPLKPAQGSLQPEGLPVDKKKGLEARREIFTNENREIVYESSANIRNEFFRKSRNQWNRKFEKKNNETKHWFFERKQ